MQGWVSIHRKIQDNWLWKEKPFSKGQAWIDLLLLANHKEEKFSYKDKVITGKRGVVYRSILWLSERWGWDRRTTKKFLMQLKSDNMVSFSCTTQGTTITIENYSFYQDMVQRDVQRTVQRDVQQVHNAMYTYNNDNNDNNDNKDIYTSSCDDSTPPTHQKIDFSSIKNYFNQNCTAFPEVREMTERRKTTIRAFIKKHTEEDLYKLFDMAQASGFLTGDNSTGWKASFDWIIKPANTVKILEGNYSEKRSQKSLTTGNRFTNYNQRQYNYDDIERAEMERLRKEVNAD